MAACVILEDFYAPQPFTRKVTWHCRYGFRGKAAALKGFPTRHLYEHNFPVIMNNTSEYVETNQTRPGCLFTLEALVCG